MSEGLGIDAHLPSNRDFLADYEKHSVPRDPTFQRGGNQEVVRPVERVRSDAMRLSDYLERRGLEVSYRIDPNGGMPQLVIWDPVSGRAVVQVPRESSLERSLIIVLGSRNL